MVMFKNAKEPERKGPLNVALYVRVSTDKQAQKEDGSIDTQLDRLNALVKYKCAQGENWVVTETLVEGEKDGERHGKSAKNADRPAYQKLLELVRAKLIDVVAVTKLDRIARNLFDFLNLMKVLTDNNVVFACMRENVDYSTPHGRMMANSIASIAQCEREITSARVKEKVGWRAEKGLPLGGPAIGYRMEKKLFAIDEPFAAHVRAADALYLETESADQVVREFRRRGYRTPSGSFYTKPMICRMLRNPAYAAKVEYQGELYDGQWPAIRLWETHQKIQALMDRNNRRKHGGRRQPRDYAYLVQSLLRCGECGRRMSPKPGTGRNGRAYHYYVCGTAEKTLGSDCPKRFVPAEPLDLAILGFMKELHLKPERVLAIARKSKELASETVGKIRRDYERVREQLGNVKQKLSHLTDVLAQSGISALATIREKLESLEADRAELQSTESRLKAELDAEATQEVAGQDQVNTLRFFQDLVEQNQENPEALKALLPRFIDYVVWHGGEKGEGQLEVALFPQPLATASDFEFTDGPEGDVRSFARESQMVGPAVLEPAAEGL
ncbi:MAG TPA: recombinase family protein, partial [Planctomycetota bacterium]|nr:recombinase family protein [Planctomycetota bacterium]